MHADVNLLEGNRDLPVIKPVADADAWKAEKALHNLRADRGVTAARAIAAEILPLQVEKLATLLQQQDDPDILRKGLETLHRIAQDPEKAVSQQAFGVALSLTIAPSTTPAPASKPVDVRRGKPKTDTQFTDVPMADIQVLTPVPAEPPDSEDT